MLMIYLASPYSHPDAGVRQRRYQAACAATASLVQSDVVVFSPIVQSHPLVDYGLPTDWQSWEPFDRAVLERCDGMVVLMVDGWQDSIGVTAEIGIAHELGMPVRYWSREDGASETVLDRFPEFRTKQKIVRVDGR